MKFQVWYHNNLEKNNGKVEKTIIKRKEDKVRPDFVRRTKMKDMVEKEMNDAREGS